MKEPVKFCCKLVTLDQLRDYLLAQRPDKEIDMDTGHNKGVGCLMTQYGRDHDFDFYYSNSAGQEWRGRDDDSFYTVAILDGYVFNIFYNMEDPEYDAAKQIASRYSRYTCGYWQDMVKNKTNK